MKFLITILVILFLYSCNSEKKARKQIESLQNSDKVEKYETGIAYMHYISQPGSDVEYSKNLVKKLLALDFFTESIIAVGMLLEKYPDDPELFYLHGLGYRNMHQYGLAMQNLHRAIKIQPDNKTFSGEALSVLGEEKVWNELQTINESLTRTTDSFAILLKRAELLFSIRQYDAVLYDLGSLSKMGSTNDSLFFTRSVSSLYKEGGRKSVEILTDMMGYYRSLTVKKKYPGK